jgi:hypothetical protein
LNRVFVMARWRRVQRAGEKSLLSLSGHTRDAAPGEPHTATSSRASRERAADDSAMSARLSR